MPIRHHDHIQAYASGGRTEESNGAGLCGACNYAKQGSGWSARCVSQASGRRHMLEIRTPTGHRYRSSAPSLPRTNSVAPESIVWE
ncbi:HNH endonuclease [Rhodococcus sp. NPDC058521]|uniref:HNH endonuclease n=1 Tax=Rhodococcus sp. NPDC058521 TaxID=3346536 RepID=UPI003648257E